MVEEAPHTAKRSKGSIIVSLGGASLPVYKGVEEGEGSGHPWRALFLGRRPPPLLLYIRGQGAPHRHNN